MTPKKISQAWLQNTGCAFFVLVFRLTSPLKAYITQDFLWLSVKCPHSGYSLQVCRSTPRVVDIGYLWAMKWRISGEMINFFFMYLSGFNRQWTFITFEIKILNHENKKKFFLCYSGCTIKEVLQMPKKSVTWMFSERPVRPRQMPRLPPFSHFSSLRPDAEGRFLR